MSVYGDDLEGWEAAEDAEAEAHAKLMAWLDEDDTYDPQQQPLIDPDMDDETRARIQSGRPDKRSIVGQPRGMRFDELTLDDLAKHSGEPGHQEFDTLIRSTRPPAELNDPFALRRFIKQQAESTPYSRVELMEALRPGRPTDDRRDLLARIVAEAYERGAKSPVVAEVLGCATSTALALRDRGRLLISG
jgi:hypothetical protein